MLVHEVYSLSTPVLVLNLDYQPVNICTVRRALTLVIKGKADTLEANRGTIRTCQKSFSKPSIIRLSHLVKRPYAKRKLTKREILLRDSHTCQYCGKKGRYLTMDHVKPRIQGGKQTWDNIVSACSNCNHKKAGRTPSQARMLLLKKPRAPYASPYYVLHGRTIFDEWKPFMSWETN